MRSERRALSRRLWCRVSDVPPGPVVTDLAVAEPMLGYRDLCTEQAMETVVEGEGCRTGRPPVLQNEPS